MGGQFGQPLHRGPVMRLMQLHDHLGHLAPCIQKTAPNFTCR